jgi:hypothetical protein
MGEAPTGRPDLRGQDKVSFVFPWVKKPKCRNENKEINIGL